MDSARTRARALSNTSVDASLPGAPLLRPFPGLRYVPEVAGPLGQLLAPPHTELDRSTRTAFLASSPYVVTHLERPEYSDGVGPAVRRWLQEGALVQDAPGLYVVRQHRQDGRRQHFLLAALAVHPQDPRVRPHEDVFDAAVASRWERLESTGVDSEPVLLVDSDPWPVDWTRPAALGQRVNTAVDSAGGPLLDVWHLDAPDVVAGIGAASAAHRFLIADGHHRYAAAARAAQRSGAVQQLLVAVVDQIREPVDLGALHRVLPTGAAAEVLRQAPRRREVNVHDVDDVQRVCAGLGFDEALVVLPTDAAVVGCPQQDGTAVGVVGSGAWVDSVVRDSGVPGDDVRYLARPETVWHHVQEQARGQSAIFLPRPEVAALQRIVLEGHTLGRKTTSFQPKPLAGAVIRLR